MVGRRLQYSVDELLALQQSPLIKRPANLPRIEQWLEPTTTQPERRTKGAPNGRLEDGEIPPKRPSLFETRMGRKSQNGEEIFLGPKVSFSAASAARHKDRNDVDGDGQHQTDELKGPAKHDRTLHNRTSGDGEARDRDADRPRTRFGKDGMQHEEDPEGRSKRGGDGRDGKDGGVNLDGAGNRRSVLGRGKFDQPWFRDPNKPDIKDGKDADENNTGDVRGGWRERERRNEERRNDTSSWGRDTREARVERDPAWMQDAKDDGMGHTMEDFAKWKQQMKAAEAVANGQAPPAEDNSSSIDQETFGAATKENMVKTPLLEGPLFGLWGPSGGEGKIVAEQVPTPAAKATKSSRFAGLFATKPDESLQVQANAVNTMPQVEEQQRPISATTEDQKAFERMMQMLRSAGTSSNGPQQATAVKQADPHGAGPAASLFDALSGQTHTGSQPNLGKTERRPPGLSQPTRPSTTHSSKATAHHMEQPSMAPPPRETVDPESGRPISMTPAEHRRPETAPPARPEPVSRDSEFLLKLMQRPRQPFSEAQIYGQEYQRREPMDMNAMLAQRPQEPKKPAPPPGLGGNNKQQQPFMAGPGIDMRQLAQTQHREPPRSMQQQTGDGSVTPPYAHAQPHKPQPSQHPDAGSPGWAMHGRGPEPTSAPSVPPGFSSGRGPAPPGLPQFHGQNFANQHQQHPSLQQVNMRGPPPAPPFYGGGPQLQPGLPPGFPPGQMNGMPQHQQQHQQPHRRPPMPNTLPVRAQQQLAQQQARQQAHQQQQQQLQQQVFDTFQAGDRKMPPGMQGFPPATHYVDQLQQQQQQQQRGPGVPPGY